MHVCIGTKLTTLQALKYHPDRNLGNEAACNARFQAIQSAQEVLSDQQQRAKYDTERIKAGLYTTRSTPTRPNMPPRAPNTNFPPPPPRPQPPTPNKSSYPTTPSSGANRYSRFARAEDARSTSAKDDAQDRTNRFKAWERMNQGQKQNRYPMPPEPPKAFKNPPFQTSRDESSHMPTESPPKMRPGWENFQDGNTGGPNLNRASSTRTPKKQGFAPGTPGGDEPAARNASAYYHLKRGGRPNVLGAQPQFESPFGGPPQHMRKPDPLGRFKSQSGDEEVSRGGSDRVSTPYATSGGERTYFSSSGLGRSASTREPPKWKEWKAPPPSGYRSPSSQDSSGKHHSASPKTRSSAHRHRSASVSSTSSEDSVRVGDKSKSYTSFRNGNGAHRFPAPDARARAHHRQSYQPYVQSDGGEAKAAGDGIADFTPDTFSPTRNAWNQQNNGNRDTTSHDHTANRSNVPTQDSQAQELYRTRQQPQPRTEFASGSTAWNPDGAQHPLKKAGSWQEKYQPQKSVNGSGIGRNGETPTMYETPGLSPSLLPPSHKRAAAWPFKMQKELRSSPTVTPYWAIPSSVWPKKLKAVPIDSLKPYQWKANTTNPAMHSANQMSNTSFTFPTQKQPPSDMPPLSKDFKSHSSENINTTFSPTDWSGKFTGNATEYFAPVSGKADHTTRGRVSPARGRPTDRTPLQEHYNQRPVSDQGTSQDNNPPFSIPKAAAPPPSTGQAKFSADEWAQIFKERKWAFPPPPPPPPSPSRQTNSKRPKSPRKQSRTMTTNKHPPVTKPASARAIVDDSSEEKAGNDTVSNAESLSSHASVDGTAMEIDENLTPPTADKQSSNSTETTPKQPSHQPPSSSVPPADNSTQANQQEPSNLNLGNLKKVSPFVPGNEGLKDLGDLSNTLPFESRPAPSTNSLAPQRLALPNPPKAPDIPEKLTQNAWERYLAQMRAYMFEWNRYNKKMLGHFSDRQRDVEDGLSPEWMNAVGEGNGDKGGYRKLMQGIEEDFRVRAHWDVSWEKHRDCLRGLGKVRERLLKTTNVV